MNIHVNADFDKLLQIKQEANLNPKPLSGRRISSGNYDFKMPERNTVVTRRVFDATKLEPLEDLYSENQCIFTALDVSECRCGVHRKR